MTFNYLDKFISYLRYRQIFPYIGKDKAVCDLGCGDGSILKLFSVKIKTGYGVDRDIMNSRKDNLYFIRADIIQPLPFENDKFDLVLLLAVLEHLESPGIVLSETKRILKPGGRFILTTPTPRSRPLLEFLAFKLKIISTEGVSDHKHYYSKRELVDLLTRFKFEILEVKSFECGLNLLLVAEKPKTN